LFFRSLGIEIKKKTATKNPKSPFLIIIFIKFLKNIQRFEFLKVVFPYFDSEWSFAQFRISDSRGIAAFGHEPNTIIVISYERNYYYARFDPINGGECLKQQQNKLAAELD